MKRLEESFHTHMHFEVFSSFFLCRQPDLRPPSLGPEAAVLVSSRPRPLGQLSGLGAGGDLLGPPAAGEAGPQQEQHHPDALHGLPERGEPRVVVASPKEVEVVIIDELYLS